MTKPTDRTRTRQRAASKRQGALVKVIGRTRGFLLIAQDLLEAAEALTGAPSKTLRLVRRRVAAALAALHPQQKAKAHE